MKKLFMVIIIISICILAYGLIIGEANLVFQNAKGLCLS